MPEFVALADLLRAPRPDRASAEAAQVAVPEPSPEPVVDACSDALAAARDARLFRARLGDAFDAALTRLLADLATDVLARELRLAPCDLAALVRRARESGPVVRVRLAAADAPGGLHAELAGDCGLPVVVDASLQRGDAVLELAGGSLDARLGVRLAAVLDALATIDTIGTGDGPLPEVGR